MLYSKTIPSYADLTVYPKISKCLFENKKWKKLASDQFYQTRTMFTVSFIYLAFKVHSYLIIFVSKSVSVLIIPQHFSENGIKWFQMCKVVYSSPLLGPTHCPQQQALWTPESFQFGFLLYIFTRPCAAGAVL